MPALPPTVREEAARKLNGWKIQHVPGSNQERTTKVYQKLLLLRQFDCIKEEFDDFSWDKLTIENEIKEKLTANNVKWLETLGIDSSSY